MSENVWLDLATMGLLFMLSAFFSGSETALMALDRSRVSYLVEKKRPGAAELEKMLSHSDRLLGGLLIGNNIVNIALSVLATTFFVRLYGERGDLLTIAILTPMVLVISEVCPKTIAARRAETVAFLVLRPIKLVLLLLSPLIWLVTRFSAILTRFLSADSGQPHLSADEIQTMIALGAKAGALPGEQHKMLHGVFELTQIRVRDVMIPRTEVDGVEFSADFPEILAQITTSTHSRFPVYKGDADNIVGLIHSKDILRYIDNPHEFSMLEVMREPYFVPESKQAQALLQAFRRRRMHMAVVLDEYGGVEGIVTLEDVLEEIVGEIQDEYDMEEPGITAMGGGRYLIDGGISLRVFNRRFNLDISEEETTTVAGLMLSHLGQIPEEGQSCQIENITLTAHKVVMHRIEMIEMLLPTPST
ncbi:MAG: CNNM domain-containing protein [Desulfuromonadaceae bacterium]|nr:CNNM domain-containing protein [Desulfuromonadaceae bacterium]